MANLILQAEGDWVRLLGNYPRGWAAFIQYGVKDNSRRYDRVTRVWLVHWKQLRLVVSMARQKYFEHVDFSTLPTEWQMLIAGALPPVETLTEPPENPYAVLYVTDDAPLEVVRAAHKVLALMNHPDRGGSDEKMMKINAAYDAIRKIREH